MKKLGIIALTVSVAFVVFVASADSDIEWWEGGNFYQIYPRSFMDSNNDGVGDLRGIASKISYLEELGMDAVWLSPIMKSPQADFGYDISDYRDIHSEYGTLADFEYLLGECKKHNVKLILDLVPNHSSDEHEWFKKSENREPGYENYYIWHPGKFDPITGRRVPPNNWVSVFRFPAWTWSPKRKQFYLHAFLNKQPDLNYRNRRIVQEMKDVVTFWLEKGVQGFRIDAVPYMFEVRQDVHGNFPDEPLTGESCPNPDDYCYTQHVYTQDQPETYDMIFQWKELMDEFARNSVDNKDTKVILTEAYTSLDNIIRYYGENGRTGSNVPFNFEVISNVDRTSTAKDYYDRIMSFYNKVPKGRQPNWVLGNHDQHRIATRLGEERRDLINILLQTLPGIAVTYQGEELGLENTKLTWEETVDPSACNTQDPVNFEKFSRDPCRTPFPWDDSKNAGFSKADTTWLKVNPDYPTMNVKIQSEAEFSHLKIFKHLMKLRKKNVLRRGQFEPKLVNDNKVMIYRRWYGEEDLVVVILNFDTSSQTIDIKTAFPEITENELPLYTASLEIINVGGVIGSNKALNAVVVPANKAVVLSTILNA